MAAPAAAEGVLEGEVPVAEVLAVVDAAGADGVVQEHVRQVRAVDSEDHVLIVGAAGEIMCAEAVEPEEVEGSELAAGPGPQRLDPTKAALRELVLNGAHYVRAKGPWLCAADRHRIVDDPGRLQKAQRLGLPAGDLESRAVRRIGLRQARHRQAIVGRGGVRRHGANQLVVADRIEVEEIGRDVGRRPRIVVELDVQRDGVGEMGLKIVLGGDDRGADLIGDARVIGVVEDNAAACERYGLTTQRHTGPPGAGA